jgi:uncharacterized protein YecE (DUF72 family)
VILKLDYIYFHTGRFVLFWADAEDALDRCLALFAHAFPDPLYIRPRSTKRRTEAFRSWLARGFLTPNQRAKGAALVNRLSIVSEHRHWIAHGSLWDNTWKDKTSNVTYMRIHRSTGENEVRTYSLDEIEAWADECLSLSVEFWDWLTVDLEASTPKRAEQAARKFRRRLARGLPV